ncbi:MAG: hypothetical protein JSW70_00725, partial [Syntrophobacterales bacterium]
AKRREDRHRDGRRGVIKELVQQATFCVRISEEFPRTTKPVDATDPSAYSGQALRCFDFTQHRP